MFLLRYCVCYVKLKVRRGEIIFFGVVIYNIYTYYVAALVKPWTSQLFYTRASTILHNIV